MLKSFFSYAMFAVVISTGALLAMAQKTLTIHNEPATAILVDHHNRISSEDRSARFDMLFSELKKFPDSTSVVFLYCGSVCQYGEIEAHVRGIETKLYFRGFDRGRIKVIHGGYRDSFEVEIWRVPKGANQPEPKPTRNINDVTFKGLRKYPVEPYDCCDDPTEMWNQFKKNSKTFTSN